MTSRPDPSIHVTVFKQVDEPPPPPSDEERAEQWALKEARRAIGGLHGFAVELWRIEPPEGLRKLHFSLDGYHHVLVSSEELLLYQPARVVAHAMERLWRAKERREGKQ